MTLVILSVVSIITPFILARIKAFKGARMAEAE
jgi:hypothetical protein